MRRAFFFSHDFEEMDDEEMFDQMVNIFEALREQPKEAPVEPKKLSPTIQNDEILALMRSYNMSVQDIQDVFNFHLD